jgi:hypothetical protein
MYGSKVVCKICEKDIDQIYLEYLKSMGRFKKKNRVKDLIEENKELKETISLLRETFLKVDGKDAVAEVEEKK